MKIAIPKEIQADEARVALTPDVVKKLVGSGFDIQVESGAGIRASYTDALYREAGARIVSSRKELFEGAEIILQVRPPRADAQVKNEIDDYSEGTVLIAFLEI
ncbi:NAD(P)(+) transhydrogenase (Re/Si-specific) subunit alpha, partial [candidate division KSB1 bacterium]|nr:NAD(P)(+) transhydrogenase (Re/Si-specific) subunit alpha [candidate division KSB1 bacterium]